jgi:hypothetical protein
VCYQSAHTQDGALTSVCRYRQRQMVYAASGYRAQGFRGGGGNDLVWSQGVERRSKTSGHTRPRSWNGLAEWCRYTASPRTSRMAAPDSAALGMKAKAALAATNSAKSSSAWVEIKIVGTAAPLAFP